MATAITILANFPCCCDQLCLFWYNIHGDTQTDHGGGEGVETGMRPAGSIPFPVRIQGMSSNGGTAGGRNPGPSFLLLHSVLFRLQTQHHHPENRCGLDHEPAAYITHSNHHAKKIKNSVIFNTLF